MEQNAVEILLEISQNDLQDAGGRKVLAGVIAGVVVLKRVRVCGAQGWSQLPSKHM